MDIDEFAYLEWAKRKLGIEIDVSIGLLNNDNFGVEERGLYSRSGSENGCRLFSVPFESMLTVNSVINTPFHVISMNYASFREDDILCSLLLFHRFELKDASPWHPHIACLPRNYHSIPNFTVEELQYLQGSNLYTIGVRWKQQIEDDFEALTETLADYEIEMNPSTRTWFSLENYTWALSTIWSRFISINHRGVIKRAMVPVVDLMNHSHSSTLSHSFMDKEDRFVVISHQFWPKDCEILLNYGNVGNSRLLMLYGFTLVKNPYNVVDVYAMMDPSTPHYETKLRLLDKIGIHEASEPFHIDGKSVPTDLLTFLRIQHLDDPVNGDRALAKISTENEAMICGLLIESLSSMLRGYSSTIDDDEAMMTELGFNREDESKFLPPAQRRIHALIVTHSEKKVLVETIQQVKNYLDKLQGGL